jgi:hypothetical protein
MIEPRIRPAVGMPDPDEVKDGDMTYLPVASLYSPYREVKAGMPNTPDHLCVTLLVSLRGDSHFSTNHAVS